MRNFGWVLACIVLSVFLLIQMFKVTLDVVSVFLRLGVIFLTIVLIIKFLKEYFKKDKE